VALSMDYALIGARDDNELAPGAGAAYLFRFQNATWTQIAKLTTRLSGFEHFFGNSVALAGDYALIGAPGERAERGAAYVFKRDSSGASEVWREQFRLQASDANAGDFFGLTVALEHDWAVIGAYGDDERAGNAGAVYLFQREPSGGQETWNEKAKLIAGDGKAEDFFGIALAMSGDVLCIGAYGDDTRADHAGAAYVFKRFASPSDAEWRQQAKLTASDGAADDDFGSAVAIANDYALVGALMQFSAGPGAAYLFKSSAGQWLELEKLEAPDAELNDRFGNAVALGNDCALVGARFESEKGRNAGAAYLFDGLRNIVHVEQPAVFPPLAFALEQNYPNPFNPFNPATTISFSLPRAGFVTLKVFDTHGGEIATIIAERLVAGKHRVPWHAGGVASGVYLCRLQAGELVQIRKLVLLQ
ncbi:MAG: hypothetical protein ACREOO_05995, partial [bacterium]